MEKKAFERGDSFAVGAGPSPDVGYFPNIDLAGSDDVAPSASKVTPDAGADSIDRLANVDRDLIEVTECIDADRDGNQRGLLSPINLDRR